MIIQPRELNRQPQPAASKPIRLAPLPIVQAPQLEPVDRHQRALRDGIRKGEVLQAIQLTEQEHGRTMRQAEAERYVAAGGLRGKRPAKETASLQTGGFGPLPWEAARRAGGDPELIGREWGCRYIEGQGWVRR